MISCLLVAAGLLAATIGVIFIFDPLGVGEVRYWVQHDLDWLSIMCGAINFMGAKMSSCPSSVR